MALVMLKAARFQVWLVQLNPTLGKEINKTRPCIIVSPDEMSALATVIVAPMTTRGFDYPCRIRCRFRRKSGLILLDQIRTVDQSRLVKYLGILDESTQKNLCSCLQEMFAY